MILNWLQNQLIGDETKIGLEINKRTFIAFHPESLIKNSIGRSSDLSLFANAFPEHLLRKRKLVPVAGYHVCNLRRDLQQRVLSGIFTPVPFFIAYDRTVACKPNRGQR